MPSSLEQLAAKGAGALKQAAGVVKGFHGVFNTLAKQHGEAAMLLEQAKLSDDVEKRLDLWGEIRTALLAHEKTELEVVYPAFREHTELRQIAEDHEAEAGQLERTIREIDALDASSEQWHAKLLTLIDLVTAHVDEEEGEWFPDAAEVFSRQQSAELDERFQQSFDRRVASH